MSQVATESASALTDLLRSEAGVSRKLFERLNGDPNLLHRYPEPVVQSAHITGDHWEKTGAIRYPQLVVYHGFDGCQRLLGQGRKEQVSATRHRCLPSLPSTRPASRSLNSDISLWPLAKPFGPELMAEGLF